MPFFKDAFTDLKKDIVKDAVKYFAAAIGGILLIWATKNIKGFDSLLIQKVNFTWYYLTLLLFVVILLASFITWILFNKKYQKLKNDSMHDELTGLYNEKAFKQFLTDAISHAKKENENLSLILIDIDNFKSLNDTYTMDDGDLVMIQLSYIFNNDKKLSDIICRQHNKGDEFIIIAKKTNSIQARIASENKRKIIDDFDFQIKNSKLVRITVSCGIAEIDLEKDDYISFIDKVDKAKQQAKASGKNCSIIYS